MQATCPLSIIIVSWNTRALLGACLGSLAAPDGMPDGTEVIVVDNASTDDSVAFVRASFPWVRLIEHPTNSGFAAATNRGLSVARGEYLLLLNSDTETSPGVLAAMAAYLRYHPHAGAVGADVRNPDGSSQPCGGLAPSLLSETFSILGLDKKARAFAARRRSEPPAGVYHVRDWVLGAAVMVRRLVYETIGPLDEGYFMYSEEVDWCTRIRAHGWRVGTLAGARVFHCGGGSARRTRDGMRPALYRSKIRYLARHHGVRSARIFRAVVRAAAVAHIARARLTWLNAHEEVTSWLAVLQSV